MRAILPLLPLLLLVLLAAFCFAIPVAEPDGQMGEEEEALLTRAKRQWGMWGPGPYGYGGWWGGGRGMWGGPGPQMMMYRPWYRYGGWW